MSRAERGRRAHAAGHASEIRAAWFLRAKCYRILCRRYKTPVGEIDLIAWRGGTLVFVEVKNRPAMETAAAAITPEGLARMRRAIEYYLMHHGSNATLAMRIDVILVTRGRLWPIHIRNAFGDQQLAGQWG